MFVHVCESVASPSFLRSPSSLLFRSLLPSLPPRAFFLENTNVFRPHSRSLPFSLAAFSLRIPPSLSLSLSPSPLSAYSPTSFRIYLCLRLSLSFSIFRCLSLSLSLSLSPLSLLSLSLLSLSRVPCRVLMSSDRYQQAYNSSRSPRGGLRSGFFSFLSQSLSSFRECRQDCTCVGGLSRLQCAFRFKCVRRNTSLLSSIL